MELVLICHLRNQCIDITLGARYLASNLLLPTWLFTLNPLRTGDGSNCRSRYPRHTLAASRVKMNHGSSS